MKEGPEIGRGQMEPLDGAVDHVRGAPASSDSTSRNSMSPTSTHLDQIELDAA
jgi:hypothetical protein